jgi:hypothetical protein
MKVLFVVLLFSLNAFALEYKSTNIEVDRFTSGDPWVNADETSFEDGILWAMNEKTEKRIQKLDKSKSYVCEVKGVSGPNTGAWYVFKVYGIKKCKER